MVIILVDDKLFQLYIDVSIGLCDLMPIFKHWLWCITDVGFLILCISQK